MTSPTETSGRRRRGGGWRRNATLLAAGVACSALLYLFLGPAPSPDPPADLQSLRHVDGTLTVVEDDRLVMRPFVPLDGRTGDVAFVIRPRDARFFDIAHMQSHSSVALPTRIYFERSAGRYFARFKDDAPANSRGS